MKNQKTVVPTKLALAKRLAVSRGTLDTYLCLAGAPDRGADGWDVEAVAAFIAARAESDATASKASDTIGKLRAREIGLRCERLKFKLECERRDWVKKTEVAQSIVRIMGPAVNLMEQKLVAEYPSEVAGLNDVASVRVYGRRVYDDMCVAMHKLAEEWPA